MSDVLTGNGLLSLPWWGYVLAALLLSHLTIACVTLYLHRSQAHRSVDFHPAVAHAMRFWLWLTTGMVTRQWVAIHRKHHARCETPEDPHSPRCLGILTVLLRGADLYRREAQRSETLHTYGRGVPDDAVERRLYSRCPNLGVYLLLVLEYLLLGFYGISLWAVQMIWIPLFAAGIINGLGHFGGYRNFETDDYSTNLCNLGLLIGGEEMHNNHHAFPSSAKLSVKWWEFDIGWLYIRLLHIPGLAHVRRLAPVPHRRHDHTALIDIKTAKALFHSRMHVMREYATSVVVPVFKAELAAADTTYRRILLNVKKTLLRHDRQISDREHAKLKEVLLDNAQLQLVYEFRHKLQETWRADCADPQRLCRALHEWCWQAEETGIRTLGEFAQRIRGYTLKSPAV